MPEVINLSAGIGKRLPEELAAFLKMAGEVAASGGQVLYLVGGAVRDLLLGEAGLDIDLVVEGDAIGLAWGLVRAGGGEMKTHPRFGTASIKWRIWSVDVATARAETYAHPGALPDVKPGTIRDDLLRRDFTVNAMAVCLEPGRHGELLDLYGGRADLARKLIRVLHDRSFTDDATRIWRGIRYEQRLSFQFEAETLNWLRRDIKMLETVSGDRMRNEIELILAEACPEKALCRAAELGVLARVHPSLKGDGWLAEKFKASRDTGFPEAPSAGSYLALLSWRLTATEGRELVSYLKLPKALARAVQDTYGLKAVEESLAEVDIAPSRIYHLLEGFSTEAVVAASLAADSEAAGSNIRLYLDKLRHVSIALTGDDIIKLGIPAGPEIKEIQKQLLDARLDGKITSRREEEMVVGREI